MFQIYKTVLVQQLPVVAQDRLVVMHPLDKRGTHFDAPATYLATIARDSLVFRRAAGILHRDAIPLPFLQGDRLIQLASAWASGNYYELLGMILVAAAAYLRSHLAARSDPVTALRSE